MSKPSPTPRMNPTPPRILPLSAEAISQIHSSKHIISLQGVVLSLLENSLDAGATKINISIDWRRGCCNIDDNGIGIPPAEFLENGGLGNMHCTSKRAPVETAPNQPQDLHGSNGMFIAELAAMSLLSITSVHDNAAEGASITIHQGKILSRRLPSAATVGSSLPPGTCVIVKDLFGNMPVRVKQRALAEGVSKNDDREWQELTRGVVGLLQAWRSPCSVRLRDVNTDSRAITISAQHSSISTSLTEKSLHRLTGKKSASHYDLRDALPMLFQSGLAPNESRNRWIPLSAASSSISLKGLICLDPAPTKQCQFISLGIRPCNPLSGQTELHDAVNKTFDLSSFGTVEEDADLSGIGTPGKSRTGASVPKQIQARKGIDRFPMYCIQVNFTGRTSSAAGDLDQMSEASLKAITDVLTAAVHAWLEKNEFRPRKRRRNRREQNDSLNIGPASSSRPTSVHSDTLPNTPSASRPSGHLKNAKQPVQGTPSHGNTPKRRKVTDISMRPASSNNISVWHPQAAPALDPSLISNIKRGRDRPRTNVASSTRNMNLELPRQVRPRTGNGIRDRDEPGPAFNSRRSGIAAEVIEAGAFNGRAMDDTAQCSEQMPSSEDFGSVDDAEMIAAFEGSGSTVDTVGHEDQENDGEDGTFTWTDPKSNEKLRVNARTGVVLPISANPGDESGSGHPRQCAGINTALSSAGKPLSLARRKALIAKDGHKASADNEQKWLPGFLREWDNPVFARQHEDPIPTASLYGPGLLDIDENGRRCCHDSHGSHPLDRNTLQNAGKKLSRSALQSAEVISQVDRKFVLCKLPTTNTLILVDQHAASERVILEEILSQLDSTIPTTHLETETSKAKPLHFEVSAQEHELFRKYQTHFTTWRMIYSLPANNILKVTHLPTLIAARCAALPSLAIDLLRSEVWALADGSKNPLTSLPTQSHQLPTEEEHSPIWLSLLPHAPAKFLEMLHSRACRSAIMFNDVLSKEDCEELMGKVAKCVFPFVCAHGRVGMVPVMELDGGGLGGADDDEEILRGGGTCNVGALERWMKQLSEQQTE